VTARGTAAAGSSATEAARDGAASPDPVTDATDARTVGAGRDTGPRETGAPAKTVEPARKVEPQSEVTARAVAFVAERRPAAEALGADLADLVHDPDAFARALTDGLQRLADPEYLEGQQRVAPGIGAVYGVRWPLMAAVSRGFRNATKEDRATTLLFLADRLFREDHLEPRWFAFGLLERTLAGETERTWQLLRRASREAGDWITVDSLAHPYGKGIAAEPYRWAELEQLVFSPSRWERRLIGSTIATMTHVDRRRGRTPDVARHGLELLGQLMGDAEPDVQKALAWAYRSLMAVDPEATTAALRAETHRAVETADGHRAWVIRDTLAKLDPGIANEFRAALAGIRKRPGAASTSAASATAARFGSLPDPATHPEPPLA
jgi:3-methyladenine DNA glycosylase AlkD